MFCSNNINLNDLNTNVILMGMQNQGGKRSFLEGHSWYMSTVRNPSILHQNFQFVTLQDGMRLGFHRLQVARPSGAARSELRSNHDGKTKVE